jgi:glycine/D-amino acid oxidase-like deaminating enzyme
VLALRLLRPIWLGRSSVRTTETYPSLRHSINTDVVVIGAGVTGAAVAWKFAAAGIGVVVLDASRVGRGSTAASTALLMQEPDEDFTDLRRRYGSRTTGRIWELSRIATNQFVRALSDLEIECDLSTKDSVYFTLDPSKARSLRRELDSRRAAGIGGRWLDERGLRSATGIDGPGAIRMRGNAQVDPYKACLGLLRAAHAHGAHIFEGSPARRVEVTRSGVSISTPGGAVHASHAVVATGYATPEFKPLLGRFRMMNTYVMATAPLSLRARRAIGLTDVMLWDTERPYHYARWTDDHRLMVGGGDRPAVTGAARRRAMRDGISSVMTYFEGLFPALSSIRIDYAWEGLFATTPDGLPYIGPHRRYPRHLFALGYGGNGMTFGFLAAQLLLDHLNGSGSKDLDLFSFGRTRQ